MPKRMPKRMKRPSLPLVPVPVVPVRQCITTALPALPCEMQAHICNWLSVSDMLQMRLLCKALALLFYKHVNIQPVFWLNKLVSSKLVWADDFILSEIVEVCRRRNCGLTDIMFMFRPLTVWPTTTTKNCQLFATVKNAEDGTLIARTSTFMLETQWDWDEGWWYLLMPLNFCVDCNKVYSLPPYTALFNVEWIVPVSIDLYFHCAPSFGLLHLGQQTLPKGVSDVYYDYGDYYVDEHAQHSLIVDSKHLSLSVFDDLDIPNFDDTFLTSLFDEEDARQRRDDIGGLDNILARKSFKTFLTNFRNLDLKS